MAPALGIDTLCRAAALGILLGTWHEFLRPLRRRRNWPADLLFLPGLLYLWAELAFRVCRTALRGYHLICFLGAAALWIFWARPVLSPVFSGFWGLIRGIWRGFLLPFEKISKIIMNFSKYLYAIWKKSVTMTKYTRKKEPEQTGGVPNGKK